MKRKVETEIGTEEAVSTSSEQPTDFKRRHLDDETAIGKFRPGLLDPKVQNEYKELYANSAPYKHAVIAPLIEPSLLTSVHSEIAENVSFTEKETDIYRIFQSGDLANLDGLNASVLSKLPSVLELRDALYSSQFRSYLSGVTGSGPLSGKKIDMAINAYTGGCHLLCHDDVIGTRRLSYILYLTHPKVPWKPEWGGGFRLYPTTEETDPETGEKVIVPGPDVCKIIPPTFNQLAFFVVQPGQSFHDVEEVFYTPEEEESTKSKSKVMGKEEAQGEHVRMAISGWFHVSQEGEEGYEEGLAEKLAEKSSLTQLERSRVDQFERPQPKMIEYPAASESGADTGGEQTSDQASDSKELTEKDFEFLLKFMSPSYLVPDTVEELNENFSNDCFISLEAFLTPKFAEQVKQHVLEQEQNPEQALPPAAEQIEANTDWKVSRPPHKHRYLYQQYPAVSEKQTKTPIQQLLEDFLPSVPFKKWLMMATGQDQLLSRHILARRFRRGQDYTLASGYDGENPQLEFTLGLTPTTGWEKQADDDEEDDADGDDGGIDNNDEGNDDVTGKAGESEEDKASKDTKANDDDVQMQANGEKPVSDHSEPLPVGGYELYMQGEDDDEDNENDDDDEGDEGAASSGKPKQPKVDPAVYRAAADGDDGILFSQPASWNRLGLVLRDAGSLKFVKYVSRSAMGDRWDITGEIALGEQPDDDDDAEEEEDEDEETQNEKANGEKTK